MANPEAYHPALFFSGKHYWRKIFVTSCMFAVMLDALFLYIPVINHDKSCVGLDKNMKVAALVSRIVSDLFYVIDIVVQIYTSEHCPRLVNEFGKRKYSSLLPTITKMIWRSYIIIDILAILPFPQIARRTEALHCQNSSSYHLPRRATSKINLVIIFLTEQLPGYYYLVDAGYPNGEGFLAPYRGQRYHLNDWREGYQPTTPEEFFNMKHSSARNVIERCFGLLKMRWAILRSPSFFPVKTQCRIVIACCLLHNLIRREMAVDPLENQLNAFVNNQDDDDDDIINFIDSSEQWNDWRRELATQMFNEWRGNRNIR